LSNPSSKEIRRRGGHPHHSKACPALWDKVNERSGRGVSRNRSQNRCSDGRSRHLLLQDGPHSIRASASQPGRDALQWRHGSEGRTMDFGTAIRTCFQKYAVFSGRARRSEYWFFVLFGILINIATSIVEAVIKSGTNATVPIGSLASLALFL